MSKARDGMIVAECRDYPQLIEAFRKWVDELGASGESIDSVAGLPVGYTMKVLAPGIKQFARSRARGLGRTSLGPLLGTLGLKLILAVDIETLERMRPRLKKPKYASTTMLAQRTRKPRRFLPFKGNPDLARMAAQARVLSQSPERKSAIGRIAANTRWRKTREQATQKLVRIIPTDQP